MGVQGSAITGGLEPYQVPGEIWNLSKQDMITLAERTQLKSEWLHNLCQAFPRVERYMSIPGPGVPPVQTLLVDIGGLYQRRKQDHATIVQKCVQVSENVRPGSVECSTTSKQITQSKRSAGRVE